MFINNLLDINKYSETNKKPTFFENLIIRNKYKIFENIEFFDDFINEVQLLELLGMLKKVNFQSKDIFIYFPLSKKQDVIIKNKWKKFIINVEFTQTK